LPEEALEGVLNLLPISRSWPGQLEIKLARLGARYDRYRHQDEEGPTRAEQMAALRALLNGLESLSSCLANLPDHLRRPMSEWLTKSDGRGLIPRHDVGNWEAYQSDSEAVELLAFAAADLERTLSSEATEDARAVADVTGAAERMPPLFWELDTATENQLATFRAAPSLAVSADAEAFDVICARIARLHLLLEEPLADLEKQRGPDPRISLRWLVRELCAIWERETGEPVTSSAVVNYRYEGRPQSSAGRFVLAAVRALCPSSHSADQAIRASYADQTVHGAVQEYVRDHPPATGRRQGRPKRGCATI
jgi:hypothetical protein